MTLCYNIVHIVGDIMIIYDKARSKVLNMLNEKKQSIKNNTRITAVNKEMMLLNILRSINHIDEVTESYIANRINRLCDELYYAMDSDPELYFTDFRHFLSKRAGYVVDSDGQLVPRYDEKSGIYSGLMDAIGFLELTYYDVKLFDRKVPNHELRDEFVSMANRHFGTKIPLISEIRALPEYSKEWKILMLRNGDIVTSQLVNPMYKLTFEEDIRNNKIS